mgnify:FL=1
MLGATGPGQADPAAVSQTFACLERPFTNARDFRACLSILGAARQQADSQPKTLKLLVEASNPKTRALSTRIKESLSGGKRKRFEAKLQSDGRAWFFECIQRQNRKSVPEELAVARCNVDAEFWTLNFLFQNYRRAWEEVK